MIMNMQQIPADNKFRNCFVAPKGWSFVSSDYSSQELNVIAYGSQDPVWLEALRLGQDLHSVCAELVYGDKWKAEQRPGCGYYEIRDQRGDLSFQVKGKCNCPGHKKLRTNVKTVNFG